VAAGPVVAGADAARAGAAETRLAPITVARRTPKSFFTSVFLRLQFERPHRGGR
jgi:hypothetical protein